MPRETITHTPDSTNIRHIEYHPDEERLIVTFQTGARHQYRPIHEKIARKFIEAPSAGKFFHACIRSGVGIESTKLDDAVLTEGVKT